MKLSKGFILGEVLVVLVILAILITVLFVRRELLVFPPRIALGGRTWF